MWYRRKKEQQEAEQERLRKEKADKQASDKAATGAFIFLCSLASCESLFELCPVKRDGMFDF